jgi:hypothetical protein
MIRNALLKICALCYILVSGRNGIYIGLVFSTGFCTKMVENRGVNG